MISEAEAKQLQVGDVVHLTGRDLCEVWTVAVPYHSRKYGWTKLGVQTQVDGWLVTLLAQDSIAWTESTVSERLDKARIDEWHLPNDCFQERVERRDATCETSS